MTVQEERMKKTSSKKPFFTNRRKVIIDWMNKLDKNELLEIAISNIKLVDCKYKLVVVLGLPEIDTIDRQSWAKLLDMNEKNIPLIKDIKGEGRVFMVREEYCFQAVETLKEFYVEIKILLERDEVEKYIHKNRHVLYKTVTDILPEWSSFEPVEKAVKLIKQGLTEGSKINYDEFFYYEENSDIHKY
ncbi:uncharacterized protein VNE69_05029 [Vairimorpha necatrix]|uniref:Uncharacterized protein n=1 Tax=Vairimorpha necatrix TaxID=6039 RepID=A0AAX4JBR1_9MICR